MTRKRKYRPLAALGVALLTVTLVVAQVIWLPMIAGEAEGLAFDERDWTAFHLTGERLVGGDSREIYIVDYSERDRPEFETGLFFLYPPFTIWATYPLGRVEASRAYELTLTAVALGIMAAFLGILSVTPASPGQRVAALAALTASMPWNAALFLGHLGTLLLLSPVAALLAWRRGRPVWAGVALGLLLAKPNLGLPMLAFLLLARQWRTAAGFGLCAVSLLLVSLPLGPGLWSDWWLTMAGYGALVSDTDSVHKQMTLLSVAMAVWDGPASDPRVLAVWLPAAAALMGWMARLWAILAHRRPDLLPRLLSTSLLALVVANPYAFHYDTLLLLPAAMLLWTNPDAYGRPWWRKGALVATALAYWGIYAQVLQATGSGHSFMALLLTVWLVVELRELEDRVSGEGSAEVGRIAAAA